MPREVKAGGLQVDGEWFAEGTEVGVPCYAIQHKEEYFPEPWIFKPERWLGLQLMESMDGEPKKQYEASKEVDKITSELSLAKAAFCAWSIGPRSCVGKTMAYQELMVVLGRMLWGWEMKLAAEERGWQMIHKLGEGHDSLEEGRKWPGEYQLWDTFASKSHGPKVQFPRREN